MAIQLKNRVLAVGAALIVLGFSLPAFSGVSLGTGGYAAEFKKIEMMHMIDADGNHMVSEGEFTKYYSKVFDDLDTDRNNGLDKTEWVGVKGKQSVSLGTGGYTRELRNVKMMDIMDKDSDHKVTKNEFAAFHHTVFATMDTSGDKQLDPQEWLARQVGH